MRVVIACAGTGGHINPGIAMANLIMEKQPQSEIIFIGTKMGIENDLVPKAGYKIYNIRTGKLLRKFTLKNISAMIDAYAGIFDSKKILKDFNPDICIGTGGYICMPVMKAAKKLHIPYILHESNSYPGLSIKLLAKKAAYVMSGFEDTLVRLGNKKNMLYTGTPSKITKSNFELLEKESCKRELGLPLNKKIVFVTFGSQGAKFLNTKIIDMVAETLNENLLYILVTGKNNFREVIEYVKDIELKKNIDMNQYLSVKEFVYNMDKMYKVADICITRGGALTITELILTNTPAILIPLPYATENHQYYNSLIMENVGSGKIIEEKELNTKLLYENLTSMMNDNVLTNMRQNLQKIYKSDVEENIYNVIEKTLKNKEV